MMASFKIFALIALSAQLVNAEVKYELIAGYEPRTLVTDIAALDLDQGFMETMLEENQDSSFEQARLFYTEGAHSLSIATVSLFQPLPYDLPKGTPLTGRSKYNKEVLGQLYVDAKANDEQIMFQYQVNEDADEHVDCKVGARPIGEQIVNGCLQRDGNLVVDGNAQSLPYFYDPFVDNNNGRTLQSLSVGARDFMYECQNCPRDDFMKFRTYYGRPDYADALINAAFTGTETNFLNGNVDFSAMSLVGRGEAIKHGASAMSVWMYVIGLLEAAIDKCTQSCRECNPEAAQFWDEAVALWTGSLEGEDGSGKGVFPYTLADKRCEDFRTCGIQADRDRGTSAVNLEIFNLFQQGEMNIHYGVCDQATMFKERIVSQMTVPLIQSTLKFAYIIDKQEDSEESDKARGAVFAASVLPMINHCSEEDATLIWENMAMRSGRPEFDLVKKAFERNYKCLAVSCDDVGGLYDSEGLYYYPGAQSCSGLKTRRLVAGEIVAIALGVAVAALLVVCCGARRLRQDKNDENVQSQTQQGHAAGSPVFSNQLV